MSPHRLVPLDDHDAWDNALEGLPCGFAYSWQHCHAMRLTTGLATFLYCRETPDQKVVCPIGLRETAGETDITKPYGFSGFLARRPDPDFATDFGQFARSQGWVCGYLACDPLAAQDLGFGPESRARRGAIVVLDLTQDDAQLMASMSSNRRRVLRHRHAMDNLVADTTELHDFFRQHYPGFMREKQASSFYLFSDDTLAVLLETDGVFILGARDDQGLAGVSVFASRGPVGDYLFHVPRPGAANSFSVQLIWAGLTRLRGLGVHDFSLGGSSTADALFEFKRRFGGRQLPLEGLKLVFRRDRFDALCHAAGKDPGDAEYFPPYRG